MRRPLSALLLFAVILPLSAHETELGNDQRNRTTRTAMIVLGSWAVGNIALSTPLYFTSDGQLQRMHEMNVGWNLVNLGIAGAALFGLERNAPAATIGEALSEQRRLESSLLLNTGLDVAYMAAGWALLERSRRGLEDSDRWAGYGSSLILQGGFLLAFDLAFYLTLRKARPVPGP